jgi:DNA polymerase I-like protein with 3'-5' exonuclease and polymerase domains
MFNGISSSEKFWQRGIDTFYDKYKGLHKWHTKIVQEVTTTGRLVMPTGRIYTYQKDKRGEWPRTTILNYPVQGLGADLMMIGRISFFRRLSMSGLTALLVSSIHDSLVVDSPTEVCYNICKILKESIQDIPMNFERLFGVPFNLPIRSEITIGPNKKDMEVWNG